MTTTLPALLTDHDLPHAELQAARLDGDVFRLDRAFCSIAEFDVPWRRASALRAVIGGGHVVSRRSAAWVWGATTDPPSRHDVVVSRHGDFRDGLAIVSGQVPVDDLIDFGGVLVTSPTRTVVDLVRATAWDDTGLDAARVRRLAAEHRVSRAGCEEALTRIAYVPHVKRARWRLDALGIDQTPDAPDQDVLVSDVPAPRPDAGRASDR